MKFLKIDNAMINIDNITKVEFERSECANHIIFLRIYTGWKFSSVTKTLNLKGNNKTIDFIMDMFYKFLNAFVSCTPIELEMQQTEFNKTEITGWLRDSTSDFLDIENFVNALRSEIKASKITIGDRIKKIRKARGLTQEEVAQIIYGNKNSRSKISEFECDARKPTMQRLEKIAAWGGVTVDYLINGQK